MFEGLSPAHLILVLAIALIILGPGKLPEVGAALGRAIRSFQDAASGTERPSTQASSAPLQPGTAPGQETSTTTPTTSTAAPATVGPATASTPDPAAPRDEPPPTG